MLVKSVTPSTPEQDLECLQARAARACCARLFSLSQLAPQALLGAEPNIRRDRRDELLTRVLSDV